MKAILTYHSIDDSGSPVSMDPHVFRCQVARLAAEGPPVYSMEELLRLPPDASGVAITFDDGFENFAQEAWPVLRDHGMPVTVFVPTAHVGRVNAWDASTSGIPRLRLMSWPQLGRIVMEGVQLGSHTVTHARLTGLSPTRLEDELLLSRHALLEEAGIEPRGLAYPFGCSNDDVVQASERVYHYACTTRLGTLTGVDAHRLPRIDMYYLRRDDVFAGWGSPRLRVYLTARAAARRCREILGRGD